MDRGLCRSGDTGDRGVVGAVTEALDLRDPVALGAAMLRARRAMRLSQTHIAAAMGLSATTISKWEHGQAPMRIDRLVIWADTCGLDIEARWGIDLDTQTATQEQLSELPNDLCAAIMALIAAAHAATRGPPDDVAQIVRRLLALQETP